MMARKAAPLVVERTRLIQAEPAAAAILVGSPGWYNWLAGATSFAFVGEHGRFTAHKERRGDTREYWKAYRHRGGRLHRAYLGKSAELTLERLDAVATELADDPPARVQAPEPAAQADAEQDLLPASTQHLLATKVSMPVSHSRLVARPRLVAQLDMALRQGRKLLLVSAPAGFGKTTLLAEWLAWHSSGAPSGEHTQHTKRATAMFKTAWLSLDDNDNDLGQFLAYLIAALERVCSGVSDDAWPLLRTQAAQPPVHAILACLVNALAEHRGPIVLILDDYHTISLQAIHEAVTFLLDHMPAHMQIAMTTRADPPLPLARLRVRMALAEVRAADLRFTHEETAALFERAHQIQLPPNALTSLEARTEGWAAGLQLAGLSLQHQDAAHIPAFLADFTGSHAYIFDYLADEVFRCQGSTVQLFLMQSAILPRLCGPLCAAVTGQHDAQTVLEQLDKGNLFLVALDSRRTWYRYHQLFRDFLYNCLHRAIGSAGIAELHRRASAWFEHNDLAGEAVEHALSAQAWGDAARCLAPLMADQRFYEYFLDWPRWSDAFPDEALQADLALCMRLARILILTGHVEHADRPLRLAEAFWQAADDQARLADVYSHRALALTLKRDFPQAIALAQRALAALPADALEQRGTCWYVVGHSALQLGQVGFAASVFGPAYRELQGCSSILTILALAGGLARAAQLQGHLQRAAALYRDVVRRAGGVTYQEQPAVYFYIGRLHYEWNELAAAERAMHDGIAIGQRTGRGRFWPSAYAALAWVCWARGNAEQSSSFMEQALAAARSLGNPLAIAEVEARQAGLWLAQGDLAAAARWLSGHTLDMQAPVAYERQIEYLMLARIRIEQAWQAPASGNLDMVANLLEGLIQAAQADERTADRIVLLALLALCHAAGGTITRALASLGTALALAEPEGYMRTFVDEGRPMRALLLLLRAQMPDGAADQALRRYIERLLAGFSPTVEATPPAFRPSPLSEREHTILQLLADGRSVPEIASRLIISVHTARTHVKHIYAKLEVHNRIQALERARDLQLL